MMMFMVAVAGLCDCVGQVLQDGWYRYRRAIWSTNSMLGWFLYLKISNGKHCLWTLAFK
jgi:hypothetical protein